MKLIISTHITFFSKIENIFNNQEPREGIRAGAGAKGFARERGLLMNFLQYLNF